MTLDSEGAIILQRGAPPHRCPPTAPHCASAVGAGDTFAAAFTLALAAGASGPCAGDIASAAAGQVVRKDGTATCTREDLLTALGHGAAASASHARALAEEYRRIGHRIVFTNGCFDLLHPGHVELLRRARALGDVLIVGLNSDESVRRRKGPRRPINSSEVRAAVLRGLRFVDDVIVFDDETPAALVEAIRPDVFVKGDDYTEADLPEAPIVRQYGGTVCLLPCAPDHSTSGLVRRIRAARRCAS